MISLFLFLFCTNLNCLFLPEIRHNTRDWFYNSELEQIQDLHELNHENTICLNNDEGNHIRCWQTLEDHSTMIYWYAIDHMEYFRISSISNP